MTKNQVISLRILALINAGMTPLDACREILGAENVEKMISDLYDGLRAKAVALGEPLS